MVTVGDKVRWGPWRKIDRGRGRAFVGTVVAVIPPGMAPEGYIPSGHTLVGGVKRYGRESYLITQGASGIVHRPHPARVYKEE